MSKQGRFRGVYVGLINNFRFIINSNEKVVVHLYLLYFCTTFINFIPISYGKIYVIKVIHCKKSCDGTFGAFFDYVSIITFFYQHDFGF